jgi:hypothetical protein
MARSLIGNTTTDLISDSGSVLWSFVEGEQLEFPISIEFINNILDGYEFECVVVEGLNVLGQEEPPEDIRPLGAQTVLNLRLPNYVGNWVANATYGIEEVVFYEGAYFKLLNGPYADETTPDGDENWIEFNMNTLFIQFPMTLSLDWAVRPTANKPVYGFFELRVTEPNSSVFRKTWKPVRGLVKILFSPTHLVPD